MAASGTKTLPTIGFLTVVEHAEWGWTGGLLILNAAGRPLEFHCTAPLKPNRAQEILYGPTLRPFLYGEQIGSTLLSKTRTETLFVCIDVEPALCVRESVSLPVVLLSDSNASGKDADEKPSKQKLRLDGAHAEPRPAFARVAEFAMGSLSAAVLEGYEQDRELVLERWQPYQGNLDLWEPFGRIREALEEAQRGATK